MNKNKDSSTGDMADLLAYRRKQKTEKITPTDNIPTDNIPTDNITQEEETPSPSVPAKKMGRPKGRRSDPSNTTLTLLIKEDVLTEARYKLSKQNRGKSPKKTLSDLVEDLLNGWIES